MSWTCHSTSNQGLVAALKKAGLVKAKSVEDAMAAVDRGLFLPGRPAEQVYEDAPQPIGHGATISAPHMHAACLELLAQHLQPGAKVLDVGSGSGYLTAVFAHMVRADPGARVAGVEHIQELISSSLHSIVQLPWAAEMVKAGTMQLITADGQMGYPDWAPYNAIHVGAAAPAVPQELVAQLAPGGRMVVPVGPEGEPQRLYVVDKDAEGKVTSSAPMGVMYVPLTSEEAQRRKAAAAAAFRFPR